MEEDDHVGCGRRSEGERRRGSKRALAAPQGSLDSGPRGLGRLDQLFASSSSDSFETMRAARWEGALPA
ncbi:MAG: hypothetical protein C4306_07660 [Thermoleophilia bacterium]